jgi:O-antigen ligase
VLGIGLYFMPEDLSMRLLSILGRFGYPTGPGVLRYIRDNPSLMQRATSTSIDPNVLGSLLNIAVAVAVPQLFIRRPVIKRVVLIPMIGVMGLCLGLTISRGSMVGLAAAVAWLGALRYRKILPVLVIVGLLILILPWTQEYVAHFIEGVRGEDLSTKMRFGEYKDSLILISRHPFLGVGFGGTPDIDTYLGVSMLYLIMAEQMGLIGLSAFLLILVILFVRFWRQRRTVRERPKLEALFYGYHAGLVGGLVSGVFDRYFFSLEFHHSVTLFWLILALATVTTELIKRTSIEPSADPPPIQPA